MSFDCRSRVETDPGDHIPKVCNTVEPEEVPIKTRENKKTIKSSQ